MSNPSPAIQKIDKLIVETRKLLDDSRARARLVGIPLENGFNAGVRAFDDRIGFNELGAYPGIGYGELGAYPGVGFGAYPGVELGYYPALGFGRYQTMNRF